MATDIHAPTHPDLITPFQSTLDTILEALNALPDVDATVVDQGVLGGETEYAIVGVRDTAEDLNLSIMVNVTP